MSKVIKVDEDTFFDVLDLDGEIIRVTLAPGEASDTYLERIELTTPTGHTVYLGKSEIESIEVLDRPGSEGWVDSAPNGTVVRVSDGGHSVTYIKHNDRWSCAADDGSMIASAGPPPSAFSERSATILFQPGEDL